MRLPLTSILFCAVATAAEWQPSPPLKENVEFAKAGDVSLTLDAYVPDGKGPFPAVIVVHGGGFTKGDKQTFVKPLFQPLTEGGFAWFTINYRLAPQYPFPAAIDDAGQAIAWVKKHAKEYKVDPKRIALMGESAGGHIVSFAGVKFTQETRVAAVVSFYGPHDLNAQKTFSDGLKAFVGVSEIDAAAREKMRAASPMTYVKRDMPPYLLIHGTADAQVPYEQSVNMCAKMKQAGASCELFTVEGAPHGVGPWEKSPAFQAYKGKMIEWLKNKLRK